MQLLALLNKNGVLMSDKNISASRVSVLSVGVGTYQYMPRLNGAINDVNALHNILVEDETTASLQESQFTSLVDPTSSELRNAITEWIYSRSALHDILIFYFSGHAVPLGYQDVGLCMTETIIHPLSGLPIQTSLFSLREIVSSIASIKADPVIILDTCFSGKAGNTIHIALEEMKKIVQSEAGSAYALMASCNSIESSVDNGNQGVFSKILVDTCRSGLESVNEPFLTLSDLHPFIREELERSIYDMLPQLFIGDTLPKFGFVQNTAYSPRTEKFTPYFIECLMYLWNNGSIRVVKTSEIRDILNAGVYGNNSKLKLEPWRLIENGVSPRTRKLTKRGVEFMKGELEIAQEIIKDAESNSWRPAPNSKMISIKDFPIQEILL
jgi:hypothetical protein